MGKKTMRWMIGVVAGLTVGTPGCANAQVTRARAEAAAEDLAALAEWVASEASFSEDARREALALLQEHMRDGAAATEADFYLRVASVVGLADNAHSNLTLGPVFSLGVLPVRTYWFSDGMYVVQARSDHASFIGARIDSIAGLPVDELVTRLGAYHGGTDNHFRHYFSSALMISPPILHAAGVADDPDVVGVSVTLQSGVTTRIELGRDGSRQQPPRTSPWRRLLPLDQEAETGTWVGAWPSGTPMPLAFRDPDTPFRYIHLQDENVVYIQLRSNIDQQAISIRRFADRTRDRLENDRPRHIILDNRFNGGGDLTRTAELALDLPTLVPPDGRIFVLTSNATFSAGIYTSFFPKATDPEGTVIVGERVGDRERFWAESRGPFILPRSRYRIGHSLQMHDVGQGCPILETCYVAGRGRLDIAVGSLEPDVEVPWTYADYVSGRDTVLDFALDAARTNGG
jgi:hypothetical protein